MDITVMCVDLCIVRVCVVDFCLDIIDTADSMENGRHYRHVIGIDSIDIEDIGIIESRDFTDGIDSTEIPGVGVNVHSIDVIDSIGNL